MPHDPTPASQPNPPPTLEQRVEATLALQKAGHLAAAEAAWRTLLDAHHNQPDALNNLANLCKDSKRTDEAESLYRRAIAARPKSPEALNNLGNLLKQRKLRVEAEACLRAALTIWPSHPDIRNNLGVLLHELQRFSEAEALFQGVLAEHPKHIESLNNLGNLLKDLRRLQEAACAYQQILELVPEHPEARWNLGLLHLMRGDYETGWPLYEARYDPRRREREVTAPALPSKQWQGEALHDKHLLIWHEQGMGDEIQFARYIPLLRSKFGVKRVTLVCKAPLKLLMQTLAGVDCVLTPGQALPSHDCWSLPGSLPCHFATRLNNIPAQLPYLSAPAIAAARWQGKFPADRQLRVGLVWAGSQLHRNDENRSLPSLELLAPLWTIPGITFFSLQKDGADHDPAVTKAAQAPDKQPLLHLGGQIRDFGDSATILQHLDLVITVDTAIAHLAGALGRTCWVLLPWLGSDWRWLESGQESPWYPGTLRLFRQTQIGDWPGVVAELSAALRIWRQQQSDLRTQLEALTEGDQALCEQLLDRLSANEK